MSDVKTFTISGNNEEIQDMIGKGASPIDDPIVDKETRDELEGDDSDTEGQSRSPDDDLQNIIDKNPEDITATETRNLKIFESEGNEEAGDKLKEIESDHESVSSDDPEDRVDMEQLIKEFPFVTLFISFKHRMISVKLKAYTTPIPRTKSKEFFLKGSSVGFA